MDHHPSSDISLYLVLGILNKQYEGNFICGTYKLNTIIRGQGFPIHGVKQQYHIVCE